MWSGGLKAMKLFDPKKILAPVDFSELSQGVVQAAVEIGELRDAEVLVLHVAKEPRYPTYYGDGASSTALLPEKMKEDARARLESQLDDLVKKVSRKPSVRTNLLWGGNPAKDIVQVSQSGNFDLIVMGTHGRSGVSRIFIGSVAEEVIRRAPCPVFVVRAKVVEERLAQSALEGAAVGV